MIKRLYRELLDREADPGGLQWYYASGMDEAQMRAHMMASAEYKQKHPNPSGFGRVVLDAGHGWCTGVPGPSCRVDPGAVANGMSEKDVVLDIAGRIKPILESRNVQVFMTRTGDDHDRTLSHVAQYVNEVNPDLSVSIHTNAGRGTGTEACYQASKGTTERSIDLSRRLTAAISDRLSLNNRGVFSEYDSGRCGRGRQLYIHDINVTASLIETAFIDSDNDAEKLLSRRQDFAEAIAGALLGYLDAYRGQTVPSVTAGGSPETDASHGDTVPVDTVPGLWKPQGHTLP